MKKLVVFVEKPSLSKLYYKHIQKNWIDYEIKFIHLHPYVNPKFVYPKGFKYKDYPLVKSIKTKNDLNILPNKILVINDMGEITLENYMITENDINSADEILYACDPDHSSAISFKLFIDNHFKENNRPIINAVKVYSHDDESLQKGIINKQLFSELYKDIVSYGEVKKYFDYNWNLNSLVILNEFYKKVLDKECNWISKYGLQLLFFIRDNQLSEGKLVENMSKWVGTGKYNEKIELGSTASKCQIINGLIKEGLIKNENKLIALTSSGELFLNSIHKDTKDADLPFRLNAWCYEGLELAKPKIDKYIKTFFGKIK